MFWGVWKYNKWILNNILMLVCVFYFMYFLYCRRQLILQWGYSPQARDLSTYKLNNNELVLWDFPADRYQSLMPVNQLNHIYIANITKTNSSNTFTRKYSWSRYKGQQTSNTTYVIEVESAECQGFSGSHSPAGASLSLGHPSEV